MTVHLNLILKNVIQTKIWNKGKYWCDNLIYLCEDEISNDTAKTAEGSLLSKDRTDVSEDKDVKIKTNNLLEFKDCHYNCCFFFLNKS